MGKALMSQDVEVGEGVKFATFNDPDGNSWVLQEMARRIAEFQ